MGKDEQVGVRELRQNLSKYLRRVEEGETLEVTERGTPVAILAPLPKQMSTIDRLIAEGRARPATRKLSDLPPLIKLPPGGPSMAEILDELREDRI